MLHVESLKPHQTREDLDPESIDTLHESQDSKGAPPHEDLTMIVA